MTTTAPSFYASGQNPNADASRMSQAPLSAHRSPSIRHHHHHHPQHQQQHQHRQLIKASPSTPPAQPSTHRQGQQAYPSLSPSSSQSSPYVSPRPQHRIASDAATTPIPPLSFLLRRGAVSGASGPLSFPPLPIPFRHASAGPGDGAGIGRPFGPGAGFDGASHALLTAPNHRSDCIPPTGLFSGSYYTSAVASSSSSSSSSPSSHNWPHARLPPFTSALSPGASILAPSSSAGIGPHFPLPSSYSLSSTSVSAQSFDGSADYLQHHHHHHHQQQYYHHHPLHPHHKQQRLPQHHHHPSSESVQSSPASVGTQRRGGLSTGSGTGIYGAAALMGAHPYWGAPGAPAGFAAGFKRKQASANPPPRNYACQSCPASFSRRHDLNRHSRIHLDVKPFACPNCEKTFSRKDALKRHLMVKGCGKDDDGRPKKRRGRKSAADKLAEEDVDGIHRPGSSGEDINPRDASNEGLAEEEDEDEEDEEADDGEETGGPEAGVGDGAYPHDDHSPLHDYDQQRHNLFRS